MNALKMIREREKEYDSANRTRIYNIVIPLVNGECRIDTYAVKTRDKRTGELAIKKVARYRSDKNRYYVRDILFHNFSHQYVVNWCNEPFGRKHPPVWYDVDAEIGIWGYCDATQSHCIDLHGEWLNGFEGTKYEHCGFVQNYRLHFIQYAQIWNECHAVEFLAKLNLWNLVTPNFTRSLLKDRGLFSFFRNSINEIRKVSRTGTYYSAYGINEIRYAYSHGVKLDEAKSILDFGYGMRQAHNVPKIVDREKLRKYLISKHIGINEYDHYCRMLERLGIDIDTYGYMFPYHWTRTYDRIDDAYTNLLRMEQKREDARRRREEKKRLAHWKLVCGYLDKINGRKVGEFTIVVPKTKEQLKAEGEAMNNCVGGYAQRLENGETILLFWKRVTPRLWMLNSIPIASPFVRRDISITRTQPMNTRRWFARSQRKSRTTTERRRNNESQCSICKRARGMASRR